MLDILARCSKSNARTRLVLKYSILAMLDARLCSIVNARTRSMLGNIMLGVSLLESSLESLQRIHVKYMIKIVDILVIAHFEATCLKNHQKSSFWRF